MSDDLNKNFQFHIPVELMKSETDASGEEDQDSWKIQGIASTPDEDLQGEAVHQDGLDISLLKAGRGLFNYDHLKGVENVLGQIDDAEFVSHNGTKSLLVKGYLFKHQPRAQAFYNIMRSIRKGGSSRVHLSIEGKILQRDASDQSVIKKARIDKVALTLDPVNPNTFVDLCKSLKEVVAPGIEDLQITLEHQDVNALDKAMAAGAGGDKAPADKSGGEVVTKEALDCSVKPTTYTKKKKKMTKAVVESIIDSVRKSFPDRDPVELAQMVCSTIKEKISKE